MTLRPVHPAWPRYLLPTLSLCVASLADPSLPPPADHPVEFNRDIRPLLERYCLGCHGEERPRGGLAMLDRESILLGSDNGAVLVVGRSAESLLIRSVAWLEEDLEMPPPGEGKRLDREEIGLLRAWIDQGLAWEEEEEEPLRYLYRTVMGHTSVSGDIGRFREHWQTDEGLHGGIGDLWVRDRTPEGTRIELRARSIHPAGIRRLDLDIIRPDLGYFGLEYRSARFHFDDSGGHWPPGDVPEADRELRMDTSSIRLELGLDMPGKPHLFLGYEHRYRHGDKSTLHRGPMFPPEEGKALYPAWRHLEEDTHVLDLGVDFERGDWAVRDTLHLEMTEHSGMRTRAESVGPGSGIVSARSSESLQQFSGANSLQVTRRIRSWWLLSAGYLHSSLDATAGFDLETRLPAEWAAEPIPGDIGRQILLSRDSHVINLNSGFDPAPGWHLFAGAESDWTRQAGTGDIWIFGTWPTGMGSALDRRTTEQQFGLRFTRPANHTLYLDTRHRQTILGLRENQIVDDGFEADNDFMRHTDASLVLDEYRTGWIRSFGNRYTLHARLRHRMRSADYRHRIDTDGGPDPGLGYPAHVRYRSLDTLDGRIQLHARPTARLQATLAWSLVRSDHELSLTEPALPHHAGRHRMNNWSLSLFARPREWLQVSVTALRSGHEAGSALEEVAPHQGESLSLAGNLGIRLHRNWDWSLRGSIVRVDTERNAGDDTPFGSLIYDREGVVTGISRRLGRDGLLRLQFGLFRYREHEGSAADDYLAHAVSLSFRRAFL